MHRFKELQLDEGPLWPSKTPLSSSQMATARVICKCLQAWRTVQGKGQMERSGLFQASPDLPSQTANSAPCSPTRIPRALLYTIQPSKRGQDSSLPTPSGLHSHSLANQELRAHTCQGDPKHQEVTVLLVKRRRAESSLGSSKTSSLGAFLKCIS